MRRLSAGQLLFSRFNIVFLILFSAVSLFPILHVFAQSFSSNAAINAGRVLVLPVEATLDNYRLIVKDITIWRAFGISVFITVVGTLINLAATSSLAYPLSRPEYMGRKYILFLVLFTMIFNAPLIPNYLLLKELKLINTLWALMIPGAIGAFNLFVMRAFFQNIPSELIDSGRMDGCGEARLIWSIVLPLSKPIMATMSIFYAVGHWNSYSSALYYINSRELYPLQVRLRELVVSEDMNQYTQMSEMAMTSPEGMKMAVIVVAMVPIMLVYPFLQKHFVKGMLIGSIKS